MILKKGVKVWYHPIIGHGERFAGVIATDPFTLGDGSVVAHVDITDEDYIAKRGTGRVHAASTRALEER
jgi:hypothetical protein